MQGRVGVACSSHGLKQGLVGNAGNACSMGWKMLQILKRIKGWLFVTILLSRLDSVKIGFEHAEQRISLFDRHSAHDYF